MENIKDIIPGVIEMIAKERAHLEWLQKKMKQMTGQPTEQQIRAFIRRSIKTLLHLEERLDEYCQYCGYEAADMQPGTIEHGEWFETQTAYGTFRVRYLSAGHTYATMEVQRQTTHERRKYWLLGPWITVSEWVCVTTNSRIDFHRDTPVIKRMSSYSTEQTRQLVMDIFACYLKCSKSG